MYPSMQVFISRRINDQSWAWSPTWVGYLPGETIGKMFADGELKLGPSDGPWRLGDAVMLDWVPPLPLEERERLGIDCWDLQQYCTAR